MKNIKTHLITILLIFAFSLSACQMDKTADKPVDSPESNKIKITTTIFPLYEFAKEVGGDKADVHLLLPPGTEPHTFEPSPSDIVKISKSDIFIYTGAGMEPWAKDILEGIENKELLIVEAADQVPVINTIDEKPESEHENENENHGAFDPHIWLDFSNDQMIIDAINKALSDKDPDNASFYINNAEKYKSKLDELDNKYKTALSNCKQEVFITGGHSAYNYLTNRYNIYYVAAHGISPDSEPTPQNIKDISDISKEHGIKYILFESLVSPRLAEAIATEARAETLVFNPAANLSKEEFDMGATFISLMDENLDSLKKALECESL